MTEELAGTTIAIPLVRVTTVFVLDDDEEDDCTPTDEVDNWMFVEDDWTPAELTDEDCAAAAFAPDALAELFDETAELV